MTDRRGRASVPSGRIYERYWRQGFVTVSCALDDPDIQRIRQECDRLAAQSEAIDTMLKPRMSLDGQEVRERMEALSDRSALFRDLASDERLLAPVRAAFGGEPLLFKDKINLRPPRTTGFQLHQDYTGFAFTGLPADDLLTVMVAIDPVTRASGALEVFRGYHGEVLPDLPDDPRTIDPARVDASRSVLIELEPGDICLFHSLVPHQSAPNFTDRPRRAAFLTYNSARHGNFYRTYYAGRAAIYR